MRCALLVAWREYAENARTKGFWIGLLLFPVILTVSITVPQLLEESKPTRYYVLVDASGRYLDVVREAIRGLHTVDVKKALAEYVMENSKASLAPAAGVDLEKVPALDLDAIIDRLSEDDPESVARFDLEQALAQVRPLLQEDAAEFEPPRARFEEIPLPAAAREALEREGDLDQVIEKLRPALRGERRLPGTAAGSTVELFAAILVPRNIDEMIVRPGALPDLGIGRRGIQYWAANLADRDLRNAVERVVNREVRRREFEALGLPIDSIERVQSTRIPIAALNPKKEIGEEEVSLADQIRQWAPVGFVYLLWIGIFTISQMLLNNTIEEKSNRIIEVLLSSVTPRELMIGKLIGIAGIGLTMIAFWILTLVGVLLVKAGPEAEFATQLFHVLKSSGLLPAFAIYFLLGYLIYSGVFLAIGSICNTLKDAQNLMGPVMLVMIVPLITMTFIPKDPNGTLATLLSWIPIYTPFIMMNRAAADPPLTDLIGTSILLVVTTIGVLWLTGRVFRIGILRTGQPPRLVELYRWLRG